ncbi:MAG: transcription elongation factor GreA [Candidatus Colwellbacteria bacterium]|nr:transcription elongation factor GreA [Candidatus Colwellbacteria bacterium]
MNYFLTEERLRELKEELGNLKTTTRLEIAERLKRAKDLGDLSENAEYQEAKEEQARVEKRIGDLENILQNSMLIKKSVNSETVDIGSTAEVLVNGKPLKFVIVGSNEARPEEGFISNESPLGRELIGRRVGDSIVVEAPKGKIEYKIFRLS